MRTQMNKMLHQSLRDVLLLMSSEGGLVQWPTLFTALVQPAERERQMNVSLRSAL